MKNPRIGSQLDRLLQSLGEQEEVELLARKRLITEAIGRGMTLVGMTEAELARRARIGRDQVRRLLDPVDTGVTLATLARLPRQSG